MISDVLLTASSPYFWQTHQLWYQTCQEWCDHHACFRQLNTCIVELLQIMHICDYNLRHSRATLYLWKRQIMDTSLDCACFVHQLYAHLCMHVNHKILLSPVTCLSVNAVLSGIFDAIITALSGDLPSFTWWCFLHCSVIPCWTVSYQASLGWVSDSHSGSATHINPTQSLHDIQLQYWSTTEANSYLCEIFNTFRT